MFVKFINETTIEPLTKPFVMIKNVTPGYELNGQFVTTGEPTDITISNPTEAQIKAAGYKELVTSEQHSEYDVETQYLEKSYIIDGETVKEQYTVQELPAIINEEVRE